MKPEVILEIPCDNTGGSFYMTFNKIEEIDDLLSTLEDARAELEHQIEMEKQRKRDKRKRAKMRRKESNMNVEDMLNQIDNEMKEFDKLPEEEKFNKIMYDYSKLDQNLKGLVKPFIDIAKSLHDLHKK